MKIVNFIAITILISLHASVQAGEAHVCTTKVLPMEMQEQISDDTVFECSGIKNSKNTFTINELAQNNWRIVSVDEGQAVYRSTHTEIYHQVVIQRSD